jgi:hypothetical protein
MDFADSLRLDDNPLSSDSCYVYIPELIDRGVEVQHDCR